MIYGYARVSTTEQREDRQLYELKQCGIADENIYTDKQSGKDFQRKNYKRLMQKLKQDDLLIIKSIDRLGRNYEEIQEQWKFITKRKKADIQVIDMPLLNTSQRKDLLGTFIADLVLQLLSFVAENERVNIRQRQAEGIAAAKRRGVKFGRPQADLPDNFEEICKQWRDKKITARQAAKLLNISVMTFYRKINNE